MVAAPCRAPAIHPTGETSGCFGRDKRLVARGQTDRSLGRGKPLCRLGQAEGCRPMMVLHRQNALDCRGHPGRRLQIAQLATGGTEEQGSRDRTMVMGGLNRLQLSLVVAFQADAGDLDRGNVFGRQSRLLQGASDGPLHRVALRMPPRRGQAADHGPYLIPVASSVGEPFQQQHPHTFSRHDTIHMLVERRLRIVPGETCSDRDRTSYTGSPIARFPAAQITISQSPTRNMFCAAAIAASEEFWPASIETAPPCRSNDLVIRDASELGVKLPVSSSSIGSRSTSRSPYASSNVRRSFSRPRHGRAARRPARAGIRAVVRLPGNGC